MAEFQKVLQIDPKSMMAYFRLAQIHQVMGQTDAALDYVPEGARTAARHRPW